MLNQRYFAVSFVLFSFLLTFGCTQSTPYRTGNVETPNNSLDDYHSCTCDNENMREQSSYSEDEIKRNESCSIEKTSKYTLGIIEYDSQGWLWNRKQQDDLINNIKDIKGAGSENHDRNNVIIVVYVHGWHHNARYGDPNLSDFRKQLETIYDLEQEAAQVPEIKHKTRKIIGVYPAWRGQSIDVPGLEHMSFWDRKNTAERVGHGAITELFMKLYNLRYEQQGTNGPDEYKNSLIIVGHSMGADIVYTALNKIMLENFVSRAKGHKYKLKNNKNTNDKYIVKTFGDLVVLINPAFEASRFTPLHDIAEDMSKAREYSCYQSPTMLVISAKNDIPNELAFPVGRRFSTLFERYRKDKPQSTLDRQTVGQYKPYFTHILTRKIDVPEDIAKQTKAAYMLGYRWAMGPKMSDNEKRSLDFYDFKLSTIGIAHDPLNPLYVIRVEDTTIMDGHNGFFDSSKFKLLDFLQQYLVFAESAKVNGMKAREKSPDKELCR